jgi:predicted metallopeptidase
MRLDEVARVIRSKNAGPLHTTIDLMFADEATYQQAVRAPNLKADAVARLYGVSANTVSVIPYAAALAIKIVVDRPIVAGTPGDRDVYGAQQHRPLLGVEL